MARKKRASLSKKTRFEVFKRDGFTCQYCGAAPPGALLHVDHVIPVADGGEDVQDNLITACSNCNLGKGARALSSVPQSIKDKSAELAEREEQLLGYQQIMQARRDRIESEIDRVAAVYEQFVKGYTLSGPARVSVKHFIERVGVHVVMDAMEIACHRWYADSSTIFRYFCGICWSRIREAG
jgi:hypothetical protein